MTGASDPRVVAANFLALSQSERGRATMYRQWANESATAIERQKWRREAEKQEDAAEFHEQRSRMYEEALADG
jgi:hypothetical protein